MRVTLLRGVWLSPEVSGAAGATVEIADGLAAMLIADGRAVAATMDAVSVAPAADRLAPPPRRRVTRA